MIVANMPQWYANLVAYLGTAFMFVVGLLVLAGLASIAWDKIRRLR